MNHRDRALKYVNLLYRIFESAAKDPNTPVNVTELFLWFSFDAMSDSTLSKTFNMLEKERWHHVVQGMQKARSLLGPFGPAPWLIHVGLKLLPRVSLIKGWYDMTEWCGKQMTDRLHGGKEVAPEVPDLAYFLLEKSGKKDDTVKQWLMGDSLLAIVAGR